MSTSTDVYSSSHLNLSPAVENAAQTRNSCPTAAQDCTHKPLRSKTFASAVGKIWTAMKQPRKILAKHFNSKSRLHKLTLWRVRELADSLGNRKSSRESFHTASHIAPAVPAPAISEERPSQSGTCRDPPLPVITATEGSISLSSQTDATPLSPSAQDTRHSPSIIGIIDQQFRSDGHASPPFSEVSTLQNSTFVNDDSSRDSSAARLPPALETNNVVVLDATHPTPASIPSQPAGQSPPRLQTSFGPSNVPGADGEDSRWAARAMNSSPTGVVDFQGMGVHFEESQSLHHSWGG